jgi:hypothetical protein
VAGAADGAGALTACRIGIDAPDRTCPGHDAGIGRMTRERFDLLTVLLTQARPVEDGIAALAVKLTCSSGRNWCVTFLQRAVMRRKND